MSLPYNTVPKTPYKGSKLDIPRLAVNDATTDFSIICKNGPLRAHKAILVAACPYFEHMFRFGGKEVQSGKLEIKDVRRDIMKRALTFMYTGQYTLPAGDIVPSTGYCGHWHDDLVKDSANMARLFKRKCPRAGLTLSPSHLLPHIEIYGLADYLDMENMKNYAQKKVEEVLHVHWSDAGLGFTEALDLAFSNTMDSDGGIRKILINALTAHIGLWVDEGEVRHWLEDNPNVMAEVEAGEDKEPYVLKYGNRSTNMI
ncbi:hypothetical protein HBI42_188890 [Parastagonospora nodorum]|nr:hypothetical protein HBI43_208010 [Parastagonospora nodorum]KAH6246392.1 hypothetical protein HBI42_188890 [Parastagonospora nodorum]KAH6390185.1 hypothetical protein HBI60_181240 [Parastagonospora nodorum]